MRSAARPAGYATRLLGVVVVVLLAACGPAVPTRDAVPASPTTTPGGALGGGPATPECSELLPAAQIEAFLDGPGTPVMESTTEGSRATVTTCAYTFDDGDAFAYLGILVRRERGQLAQAETILAEIEVDQVVEEVGELGDRAWWTPETGQLIVFSGDDMLIVTAEERDLDDMRDVARMIIDQLGGA